MLLRKASEKVLDSLSSQDSLNKGAGNDGKKPIEMIHQALRMIHSEYGFDLTLLCLPSGSAGRGRACPELAAMPIQVTPKFRCAGPRLDIFQVIMSKKSGFVCGRCTRTGLCQVDPGMVWPAGGGVPIPSWLAVTGA